MLRRPLALLAVLAVTSIGVLPSHAASKAKPKPINFSYEVSLSPDPTGSATALREDGCSNLLPQGKNIRPFAVPAAGRLKVSLVAPDPTGKGIVFDWDLWVMEPEGVAAGKSNSAFTNEAVDLKFKKKIQLSIQVCELSGLPAKGTVTVSFVYA